MKAAGGAEDDLGDATDTDGCLVIHHPPLQEAVNQTCLIGRLPEGGGEKGREGRAAHGRQAVHEGVNREGEDEGFRTIPLERIANLIGYIGRPTGSLETFVSVAAPISIVAAIAVEIPEIILNFPLVLASRPWCKMPKGHVLGEGIAAARDRIGSWLY